MKEETASLQSDPMIKDISEVLWKPAQVTNDPDHVPPVIGPKGIITGVIDPPLGPETFAEKMTMMNILSFRPKTLAPDPDLDERLVVSDGQIIGVQGLVYSPETDKENLFLANQPDQAGQLGL